MTNMKPAAGGGAVAKVPGPANDEELGETYMVHQESANIKLENQQAAASPIPFHPGALKYFAEKGVKLN